jgi:hypothetical protein
MKYTLYNLRPAIAMIELIFAIMVMGIVMMSVPQLLTTATDSSYVAIQQEGISEAATQVNIVMGYEWDENNTIDGHTTVLNTNGNAGLRGTLALPKRRAGTPIQSQRLFISYDASEFNATPVALLGADGGDLDDMDDFSGATSLLEVEAAANNSDYLEKQAAINIATTVTYMSDAVAAGTYTDPSADNSLNFTPTFATLANTSNIKRIQVTLTSTSGVNELNKTIVLHAFSSNIGSYALEERP